MSERKTAEIKFRIEPSVKARWQALAADETDGNLSELISRAVQEHAWAKQNARLDGLQLLNNAIPLVANPEVPEGEVWLTEHSVKTTLEHPLTIITNITDASPQEDVSTSDEVGAKEGGLREYISTNINEAGPPLTREALDDAWFGPLKSEKSVPKSWMFEGQHG